MLANGLFIVGVIALLNSVQCFVPSLKVTQRIYQNTPVSPLASRLMGCWTLTSSLIRIYCSFYMENTQVYQLTLMTFLIAFLSFNLEVFVYKTAQIQSPGVFPAMIISTAFTCWMLYEM
jgi:Erg28 like protein